MEKYIIDVLKSRIPIKTTNMKMRKEKDFLIATAGAMPRSAILNAEAREIFELCEGSNNIEKIIGHIAYKHKETEFEKISCDIIVGLRDIESANLINLINDNRHNLINDDAHEK